MGHLIPTLGEMQRTPGILFLVEDTLDDIGFRERTLITMWRMCLRRRL